MTNVLKINFKRALDSEDNLNVKIMEMSMHN